MLRVLRLVSEVTARGISVRFVNESDRSVICLRFLNAKNDTVDMGLESSDRRVIEEFTGKLASVISVMLLLYKPSSIRVGEILSEVIFVI